MLQYILLSYRLIELYFLKATKNGKKKMSMTYKDNIYFRILSVFPLKPVNAAKKTPYFSRIFFLKFFFCHFLILMFLDFPKHLLPGGT